MNSPGAAPATAVVDLRRLGARAAASAILFALTLGAALEIGLRVQGRYADRLLTNTPPDPDGIRVLDPQAGHLLAAGASGICRRTEFSYPVRSNSMGFRDDEIPAVKEGGEARLWVVGDSVVSGYGVPEEERFTERLEEILTSERSSAASGRRIRVMNSGVGGHGTWHEAAVLERYFDTISPDAVLLVFSTTNDFVDNARFARWRREGGAYYLVPPPAPPWRAFLRDHLHVYHLLGSLVRRQSRIGAVTDEERDATVQAMRRAAGICAEHGVPLTVALVGTLNVFEDLADPRTYLADAYRTATAILNDERTRTVDTLAALREDPDLRSLFYPLDRHPNAAGHDRLARLLAAARVLP